MRRTTPVLGQGLLPHEDEDLHPPGVAELEGLDVVEVHGAVRRQAREVHPRVGQSGQPARGARSSAAGQLGVEEVLLSPSTPRQWARTHHMKQRWSSFRGFQMAFFLARVSGSSFQQPPASLGGGGAGMSASCCEGAVSRYAAVMPATVQSDSGKRERSSATSNFVLMAAIMVPARADGDAGLTIHPRPRRLRPGASAGSGS